MIGVAGQEAQVHRKPNRASRTGAWLREAALWSLLCLLTLLIHGYHPYAEDGGLYLAELEHTLDPTLFPHYTAFVSGHLRFSLFAPAIVGLVRMAHSPLPSVVFGIYLASTALTFLAADRLLRSAGLALDRLLALVLLAAWWALPVAGTSLLLLDPYLTARSFSTPLSLLALALALDALSAPHSITSGFKHFLARWSACALCLVAAALFHPLMAGYATGLILCLAAAHTRQPGRWWVLLGGLALLLAWIVQAHADPETPASTAAAVTRYYWFLARWQWYELLGLAGPFAVLLTLLQVGGHHLSTAGRALCRAAMAFALIGVLVAALFARENAPSYAVARLQPLRSFHLVYLVMILLLGSFIGSWLRSSITLSNAVDRRHGADSLPRWTRAVAPWVLGLALALPLYIAQRLTFPTSASLELPWTIARSPNPWVQAFLWAGRHTPKDALFALDARYINEAGEDAQTFRSLAGRSALPDYSKDGGEASITPALAPAWAQGTSAQAGLSSLEDAERDARLRPLGVTWMILHTSANTQHPCPFRNAVVKVCRRS